jgi:hypothetical protein
VTAKKTIAIWSSTASAASDVGLQPAGREAATKAGVGAARSLSAAASFSSLRRNASRSESIEKRLPHGRKAVAARSATATCVEGESSRMLRPARLTRSASDRTWKTRVPQPIKNRTYTSSVSSSATRFSPGEENACRTLHARSGGSCRRML